MQHGGSFRCGIRTLSYSMEDQVPDQRLSPGSLPWEPGVLATGPPGKSGAVPSFPHKPGDTPLPSTASPPILLPFGVWHPNFRASFPDTSPDSSRLDFPGPLPADGPWRFHGGSCSYERLSSWGAGRPPGVVLDTPSGGGCLRHPCGRGWLPSRQIGHLKEPFTTPRVSVVSRVSGVRSNGGL